MVLIDYNSRKKKVIVDNINELKSFYEKSQKYKYIWVGYNSRNYDSVILKGLLMGKNAYDINDKIINQDLKAYQILGKEADNYPLLNFDISTRQHSLKQLEGFMGSKIKESDIPFDIDRKLNENEITETISYCTHDVEQTIEVFENLREEFDSQISLIEAFNLPLEDLNKTKAQLSAKILDTTKQEHDDEFDLIFPDTLILDKYSYILDWFKDKKNHNSDRSLYTEIGGIPHVVAWGGIHGSRDNYVYKGKIMCADVASLYPSIMIEYGLLSRNVKEPQKFREIRDTRLKLKKEKNPMQLPYKIVLNSTYGASGDKYNPLFDLKMCRCVCLTGQLLLIDLIEKIEPYCTLIQSNTDGVYVSFDDENNIPIVENLMHEWEKRTRLDLEIEYATGIYQKDVNNYCLLEGDKYKSKGAYVKKLTKIDYDLPIINKALINYFTNDIPLEQTINECDNLIEFQKVVKVSRLFEGIVHGEKLLKERVIRVFASNEDNAEGVFRLKNGKPEKIGNTPEKCFIYNDSVTDVKVPAILNKQYYIDMTNKRLYDFFNTRDKTHKEKYEIKGVSNIAKNQIEDINNEQIYENFYELLTDLSNLQCNRTQLKILIKLGYLSNYGDINELLKIIELFEQVGICKNLSYLKCDKLQLKKTTVRKYAQKETKSGFNGIDNEKLIKSLLKEIEIPKSTVVDKIKNECEHLGYIQTVIPTIDSSYAYVTNIERKFKHPIITMYRLNNGDIETIKVKANDFDNSPIQVGDIIKTIECSEEKKWGRDENGNFYQKDEKETILKKWTFVR